MGKLIHNPNRNGFHAQVLAPEDVLTENRPGGFIDILTFRPFYAAAFVAIFAIETLIALFVDDWFVRPFVGDALAVVFVYCGFMAVLKIKPIMAATVAVSIGYIVEILQSFKFLKLVGLSQNRLAAILFGTTFAWTDMLAYTLGFAAILIFEKLRQNKS